MAWVAAASVGTFVAGCGDDSGNGNPDFATNGNPDIAMNLDMAQGPDMAMPGDMSVPGSGAVNLIDIFGTVYQPIDADAGTGETAIPAVHMILANASFSKYSIPSDYNMLTIDKSTFTLSGCDANAYDTTSTTGHQPQPDVNAGTVTMTGFTTKLMVPAPGVNPPFNLAGPISDTIVCALGSTLPFYGCIYKGSTANPVTDNRSTNGVVFPPIPNANYGAACSAAGTNAGCGPTCNAADVVTLGGTAYCLQSAFLTGNGAGATGNLATIAVAGGSGFNAATSKVGDTAAGGTGFSKAPMPENVIITNLTVAGTPVDTTATGGVFLLDLLKGTDLDGTKDIAITWACAPGAAGTGCSTVTGLGDTNFVGVAGVSSQLPRTEFGITPKYGTLNCFEKESKSDHTITIPKAAVAALTKNQSGGSAELILIHIEGAPVLTGQSQLHAAGHGQFAFISLP
jgi:hypothetical protein